MAFFPGSPMPKSLKRETANEVDDSPSIYNARDYNIHHRELLAIQRLLVGDGLGQGDSGMLGAIIAALNALKAMSNGGSLSQYSGSIESDEYIPIPSQIQNTQTGATLLATDTTIDVVSTAGFPKVGFLTKFNNTNISDLTKKYAFGKSIMNYEIIRYSGKTDTSFIGCTREVDGFAQDLEDPYAVIIGGKASLLVSPDYWKVDLTKRPPLNVNVEHDARLKVLSRVWAVPTVPIGAPGIHYETISTAIRVAYSLSVVASFENVPFSQNLA